MNALSVTSTAKLALAACSDEALVGALAQSDEKAFAEIYGRYWEPLLQQALRKLGSREEAEEVVQDLFVTLWHKRLTARIQQLDGYLFAALKYKVIDCLRAQLVREAYAATGPHHTTRPHRCTEDAVAIADLSEALTAGLHRLPDSAREVFQLSRHEHQSVPEIAARLRVSPKTVEYHLSRSLRFLRRYLRDFLAVVVIAQATNFQRATGPGRHWLARAHSAVFGPDTNGVQKYVGRPLG